MLQNVTLNLDLVEARKEDIEFLYELYLERDDIIIVTDSPTTTFEQHKKFFLSKPYQYWYIITNNTEKVGSVNLDKDNGIGIYILKKYQDKGIGQWAYKKTIELHPRKKYYANINPNNKKSINMILKCGYKPMYIHFELIKDSGFKR